MPSIVILGTDAMRSVEPSTPIQLIHACYALGFAAVIPASWGDELIAAECGRQLIESDRPLIQCSCPLVARRLLGAGDDLLASMVPLAPPPVAAARYARALSSPRRLHVTYIGGCEAANDESIDLRLTPDELLAGFRERGIFVEHQPRLFESVLPPDRRRFYSDPSGSPAAEWTKQLFASDSTVVEPRADDLAAQIAQVLLSGSIALVNPAPAVGCSCVGELASPTAVRAAGAREAPRAPAPILDPSVAIDLSYPLRQWVGDLPPKAPLIEIEPEPQLRAEPPRLSPRSTPTGVRQVSGPSPMSRDTDGRQLPRTYVARRRSSPRGIRGADVVKLMGEEENTEPSRLPV